MKQVVKIMGGVLVILALMGACGMALSNSTENREVGDAEDEVAGEMFI